MIILPVMKKQDKTFFSRTYMYFGHSKDQWRLLRLRGAGWFLPANQRPCRALTAAMAAGMVGHFTYTLPCRRKKNQFYKSMRDTTKPWARSNHLSHAKMKARFMLQYLPEENSCLHIHGRCLHAYCTLQ